MRRKRIPSRGAPIANQNARKHGYYSQRINFGGKKLYFYPLLAQEPLDFRIHVAFAKLQAVHTKARGNTALFKRARGALFRLIREQKALKYQQSLLAKSSKPVEGSDE